MFKVITTLLQSIFSRSSSAVNSDSSVENKVHIQKQALESNKADAERLLKVVEEEKKRSELELLNLRNEIELSREDVRQAKLQTRIAKADLENTKTELKKTEEELNKVQGLLIKARNLNNTVITSLENTKLTLEEIKNQEPETEPYIAEAVESLTVSRKLSKEEVAANILKAKEDVNLRKRLRSLKAKDNSPVKEPESKRSPKKLLLE